MYILSVSSPEPTTITAPTAITMSAAAAATAGRKTTELYSFEDLQSKGVPRRGTVARKHRRRRGRGRCDF